MAFISQTTFSNAFSWMRSFVLRLKFVPKGPIDNKSALVKLMAWRLAGDKPVLEPMLTQFTDACMRHYYDVIMSTMASQITSLTALYSIVYLGADQRKHQSSASLAFGNSPGPVNSPHKGPVKRNMFPFDDVILHICGTSGWWVLINR